MKLCFASLGLLFALLLPRTAPAREIENGPPSADETPPLEAFATEDLELLQMLELMEMMELLQEMETVAAMEDES